MSTFKKALSFVLALVMLVGTISCLSGVFTLAPVASAAGTSNVKSVADLDKEYAGYLYAYYATDIYETNASNQLELTDFYVKSGDILTVREYLKTNYYVGCPSLIAFFDNDFFETTDVETSHVFGDGTAYTAKNSAHPIVSKRLIKVSYIIKKDSSTNAIFTGTNIAQGFCGMDTTWLANKNNTNWGITYDTSAGTNCALYRDDAWFIEWRLIVKSDLAEGDTGLISVNSGAYKTTHIGQITSRATGNIPYGANSAHSATQGKNMHLIQSTWQDYNGNAIASGRYIQFDYADYGGEFTIGEPKKNEITVTDGENTLFSGELLPGDALKLDTIPSKDNYVLVGLSDGTTTYTVNTATGEVQNFKMPATTVALTAVFEGKPVTAVFNYNDGVTANLTTTIKFGEVVAENSNYPADPTRANYTFAGWAVDGTVIDETFTMPGTTTTFVAQWKADEAEYTVNYYTMGTDGEYGAPVVDTLSAGIGETVTAATAAPEGYYVDTAASTLSGVVLADGSLVLNVYYALAQKPVCTITFNSDGGSAVEAISAESGTTVNAPTAPTKPGYSFAGWVDADGTAVTFPYELVENVEFKATWNIEQFTVTFIVDGEVYDAVTDDYGAPCTAPVDPEKTGYVFTEWYPAVPATIPAVDTEIVAQFEKGKFDAVFYVDGDIYKTVNDVEFEADITAPADPTKTGYSFTGWDPEVGTMDAEGKTFNATFKINEYTVSFETGTTDTIASQTLEFGAKVTKPADPNRTGYTFGGWAVKGQTVAIDFDAYTVPANDVTLAALWTAKTYTVKFYLDKEATEPAITADVKYGGALTLSEDQTALLVKEGYAFESWVDKATDTVSSTNKARPFTGRYETDGDRSFYATWTETSKVTFMYKDYTTGEWAVLETLEDKVGKNVNLGTYASKITSALVGTELNTSALTEWYSDAALTTKVGNYNASYTLAEADITLYYKSIAKSTMNIYDGDTLLKTASGNEYQSMNVDVKLYGESGYMAADLVDENGDSVVTNKIVSNATDFENASVKFYFQAQGGANSIFVAYAPITYKLTFTGTTAEAQVFTVAFGDNMPEVKAPEIGGDGADYRNPGYTFAGWKSAQVSGDTYTALPETISAEMVENNAYISGDGSWNMVFRAAWNAMTFTATFLVDGEEYATAQAKTGAALSTYAPAAPTKVGYSFSNWTPTADYTAAGNNYMPPYDVTYEAVFSSRVIKLIYLRSDDITDISSTNNEANGRVIVTKNDALNGVIYYDDPRTSVVYSGLTQDRWPEGYILDGFEVIESESASIDFVKDEATGGYAPVYAEGYDAPAGEIATVYFKPVYKEYGDFWIRIYNADGYLYRTFGKDFKSSYWNYDSDRVDSKDEAVVMNPYEIDNIQLGYTIEFNFDGGFNLRLDPLLVRRSLFTISGFLGIMEALGNALGSLL